MLRLAISVEGQTENEFVRNVITPHLWEFGIDVRPKIVVTKRRADDTNLVGGSVSVARVAREVRPLLHSFDQVTSLYDFYGFRERLPFETVDALEHRLAAVVGNARFIPYVQRYEFESLLFGGNGLLPPGIESVAASTGIRQTVSDVGDPELINDAPDTAPSRRLSRLFVQHFRLNYDKTRFGPQWAAHIGLPALRANCSRFGGWITRLERLAQP